MSSDNGIEEEQFQISKSVFSSYVVASMVYEYIMAQNIKQNPKGEKFLLDVEKIARDTITTFGIPQVKEDAKQVNEYFMKKVIDGITTGKLKT